MAALRVFPTAALVSGDWEYTLANNVVTITKYNGRENNIVVPSTLGGFPVKDIGGRTFYHYSCPVYSGSSITIPEGVETIVEASCGYVGVETINLPSTIKTIGRKAFCLSTVANITLPEGLKTLGTSAFEDCYNIKSITVPSSVSYIGDTAFGGSGLVSAEIKNGVKTIGASAFSLCKSLESVSIPNTVTSIGSSAFYCCEKLKALVLPWGIKTIPYGLIYGCKSLKEFVIPTSVTSIENSAFWDCSNLKTLIIPTSVKQISSTLGAISSCDALETLSIPSSVKTTNFGGTFCPNMTVYVVKGSDAAAAAQKYKCSYVYDSSADSDIQVLYNGSRISFGPYGQNPLVSNKRNFVPLRSIFEAMGATVSWDAATSTVTSVRGGTTVKLTLGSNVMYVNGTAKTLDVSPFVMHQRTLVPVHAIAEAFGANVGWNQAGRLVTIAE